MSLKSKSILAAAIVSAVAMSQTTSWAGPVLTLDVQVAGISGGGTIVNAHSVTGATATTVLNLQIWGIVVDDPNYGTTGLSTTPTTNGLSQAQFRVTSSESPLSSAGVSGNYSTAALGALSGSGVAGAAAATPYDGVGGTDWGGGINIGPTAVGYFTGSSSTIVAYSSGSQLLLGTINYSVTSAPANGSTLLEAIPFVSNTTGKSVYKFQFNNIVYANTGTGAPDPANTTVAAWAPGEPNSILPSSAGGQQRIRIGGGVAVAAVTSSGGGGSDTVTLSNAAGTGTQGAELIGNNLPTSPVPPAPVVFGTLGTGVAAGSLQITNLLGGTPVYVLVHASTNAAGLTHLPAGVVAVDLTGTIADPTFNALKHLYTFANIGFLLSTADDAGNNFFNWDLTADNATIDQAIAVPEPASIGLAAVGALSLLVRRRRSK